MRLSSTSVGRGSISSALAFLAAASASMAAAWTLLTRTGSIVSS